MARLFVRDVLSEWGVNEIARAHCRDADAGGEDRTSVRERGDLTCTLREAGAGFRFVAALEALVFLIVVRCRQSYDLVAEAHIKLVYT